MELCKFEEKLKEFIESKESNICSFIEFIEEKLNESINIECSNEKYFQSKEIKTFLYECLPISIILKSNNLFNNKNYYISLGGNKEEYDAIIRKNGSNKKLFIECVSSGINECEFFRTKHLDTFGKVDSFGSNKSELEDAIKSGKPINSCLTSRDERLKNLKKEISCNIKKKSQKNYPKNETILIVTVILGLHKEDELTSLCKNIEVDDSAKKMFINIYVVDINNGYVDINGYREIWNQPNDFKNFFP